MGRNRAAVVGYNSEANVFANHPLSGLTRIGGALSCTSNVGRIQKRQNAVPNNMVMSLPANINARCLQHEAMDRIFFIGGLTPESLAAMLNPCPCTLQQVTTDTARFTRLPGPNNCYISSRPIIQRLLAINDISLTQMCCYVNG